MVQCSMHKFPCTCGIEEFHSCVRDDSFTILIQYYNITIRTNCPMFCRWQSSSTVSSTSPRHTVTVTSTRPGHRPWAGSSASFPSASLWSSSSGGSVATGGSRSVIYCASYTLWYVDEWKSQRIQRVCVCREGLKIFFFWFIFWISVMYCELFL